MTQFTSFEALSAFHREQIEAPDFDAAFAEQGNLAQLSIHDEPMATDLPDPQSTRAAMEMIIGTVFDLFCSTRMEEFGRDIVWGFVNSFQSLLSASKNGRMMPPGSSGNWHGPSTLRKTMPSNSKRPSASARP